jgi:dipeptidase E
MKLLLTSAGIKNATIHTTLIELLGKPIAESSALVIPTAIYAYPVQWSAMTYKIGSYRGAVWEQKCGVRGNCARMMVAKERGHWRLGHTVSSSIDWQIVRSW